MLVSPSSSSIEDEDIRELDMEEEDSLLLMLLAPPRAFHDWTASVIVIPCFILSFRKRLYSLGLRLARVPRPLLLSAICLDQPFAVVRNSFVKSRNCVSTALSLAWILSIVLDRDFGMVAVTERLPPLDFFDEPFLLDLLDFGMSRDTNTTCIRAFPYPFRNGFFRRFSSVAEKVSY